MTIRFILLVNKQGQTRVAQYYEYMSLEERRALEGEIVRKCLARSDQQVKPPQDQVDCSQEVYMLLAEEQGMAQGLIPPVVTSGLVATREG